LPPQRCGVSQHVHNLIGVIDTRQLEIFALTYWECGRGGVYEGPGLRTYHPPTLFLPDRIPLLRGLLYLLFGLVWGFFVIKRKRIDFVHAHVVMPQGLLAYLLRKMTGIKYIYTAHGAALPLYWGKGWLFQVLIKRIVGEAEIVTSVCQRNCNFLKRWNKNCLVIPNGIGDHFVEEFFRQGEKIERGKDELVRILFVGHINEHKGVDLLISATDEVVRRGYRKIIVELVGGGSPRAVKKFKEEVSRRELEKYIIFEGIREDVPSLLSKADLFVLPSRVEGSPTTILEALAVGVPVIASNVGGIPDIIRSGKNGILVPSENKEALIQAMMRLIRGEGLRKKLILEGYKTIRSYRWSRIASRYLELYRRITRGEAGKDEYSHANA